MKSFKEFLNEMSKGAYVGLNKGKAVGAALWYNDFADEIRALVSAGKKEEAKQRIISNAIDMGKQRNSVTKAFKAFDLGELSSTHLKQLEGTVPEKLEILPTTGEGTALKIKGEHDVEYRQQNVLDAISGERFLRIREVDALKEMARKKSLGEMDLVKIREILHDSGITKVFTVKPQEIKNEEERKFFEKAKEEAKKIIGKDFQLIVDFASNKRVLDVEEKLSMVDALVHVAEDRKKDIEEIGKDLAEFWKLKKMQSAQSGVKEAKSTPEEIAQMKIDTSKVSTTSNKPEDIRKRIVKLGEIKEKINSAFKSSKVGPKMYIRKLETIIDIFKKEYDWLEEYNGDFEERDPGKKAEKIAQDDKPPTLVSGRNQKIFGDLPTLPKNIDALPAFIDKVNQLINNFIEQERKLESYKTHERLTSKIQKEQEAIRKNEELKRKKQGLVSPEEAAEKDEQEEIRKAGQISTQELEKKLKELSKTKKGVPFTPQELIQKMESDKVSDLRQVVQTYFDSYVIRINKKFKDDPTKRQEAMKTLGKNLGYLLGANKLKSATKKTIEDAVNNVDDELKQKGLELS